MDDLKKIAAADQYCFVQHCNWSRPACDLEMSDSKLIAFRRWRPKKLLCFVYQLRPSIPNIEFLSVKMTLKLVELDDISKSRFCEQKARRISMQEFFFVSALWNLGRSISSLRLAVGSCEWRRRVYSLLSYWEPSKWEPPCAYCIFLCSIFIFV